MTRYLPVWFVLTCALTRPLRLNTSTSPFAGASHESSWQMGDVGPRMTTPRSPEAVRESAVPANAEASASIANPSTSARTAGQFSAAFRFAACVLDGRL